MITYTNGQKMANKTLYIELVSLQKNIVEGYKLHELSNKVLYRNLVETYMFWRKANMQSAYLENCYKKKNIKFKKKEITNQILFHY